ncbi:MAG TPA: hypothetical protein VK454_10505, partial [Myxococcaceae bacterium]|nr:hypothetical protein [Myxococcaceae bacterium]
EALPPAAISRETTGAATRFRLYIPSQVVWASLLATPLCACWLVARNFHRLGDGKKGTPILIAGGMATAVQAALGTMPRGSSRLLFPVVVTVALYQYVNKAQGRGITEHRAAGGGRESWWKVIGIALLFDLGLLAIATVAALVVN